MTDQIYKETVPLVEIFRLMADCGCLSLESQPTSFVSKIDLDLDCTVINKQKSYINFLMPYGDNISKTFLENLFKCSNICVYVQFNNKFFTDSELEQIEKEYDGKSYQNLIRGFEEEKDEDEDEYIKTFVVSNFD